MSGELSVSTTIDCFVNTFVPSSFQLTGSTVSTCLWTWRSFGLLPACLLLGWRVSVWMEVPEMLKALHGRLSSEEGCFDALVDGRVFNRISVRVLCPLR